MSSTPDWPSAYFGTPVDKYTAVFGEVGLTGEVRAVSSTLYSAFTRLEKNGFVESYSENVSINGKRRTYYKITEQGRQYYRDKCAEWTLTKEVVEKFIKQDGGIE